MFHAFTDTFSLVVTGVQCLNLFAGLNEVQAPTAYSKFASKSAALSIPSLYGMLVIYTPATCAAAYCVATAGDGNGRELIIAAMLLGHFAKRVAETLCVASESYKPLHAAVPFAGGGGQVPYSVSNRRPRGPVPY